MSVMIFWENLKGFEAWKISTAFKEAHKPPI